MVPQSGEELNQLFDLLDDWEERLKHENVSILPGWEPEL